MQAKVRYEITYGQDQTATYDILIDTCELPIDDDWEHLFYTYVEPELAEIIYDLTWLGVQYQ